MLRGIVISGDSDLGQQLEEILIDTGQTSIVRRIDRYLEFTELDRVLRAHAPQMVFLSLTDLEKATQAVKTMEKTYHGLPVVAFHRDCSPRVLMETMRIGIREFLPYPFTRESILETLARVRQSLEERPLEFERTDLVFSFLPSKAGVGTSTLAMNTATALSRMTDKGTFLADFDLNSGMLRFMMKLTNSYSVIDATEHAGEMDEDLWPQLVSKVGNLDVLHAGRLNPGLRIEAHQMRALMDFVRRTYRAVCLDLSGNMERYSLEIMHESKRIFLVCTPELPSLHLARERFTYLQETDLADRVSVLLNRCQKKPMISPAQIEQLLGLPVHMTFPNDYQGVHHALTMGKPVDSSGELGQRCTALAHALLNPKPAAATADTRKRFVEYFTPTPKLSLSVEHKKPG
jgi:pilus assembly protein CpaE